MSVNHADPAGAAVREEVRARYAEAAGAVAQSGDRTALEVVDNCCEEAPACCSGDEVGPSFGAALYSADEQEELPAQALVASLGCGNPTMVAELRPGERVLDLGSGGGIDVLLSARRVGPTGFAYGVDMTDEMLEPGRTPRRPGSATWSSARASSRTCRLRTGRSTW
jgi:2-polyprenyl-3-methyl-5-hydroxy-6-metoxy-1,4-benzoquinol methylase